MKDILFLLSAPFPDTGRDWYCNDCATLEGALLANPHWPAAIDVRRVAFPRPRAEVIALVGEEWQSLPMLVMNAEGAPEDATVVGNHAVITDVRAIGRAITSRHGGAGPHP